MSAAGGEGARLADELREALDDPRRGEWGGYPWEHLGDAERDARVLLDRLGLLEEALRAMENDWCFVFNLADGVELTYDVRRALAEKNIRTLRAALAGVPTATRGET